MKKLINWHNRNSINWTVENNTNWNWEKRHHNRSQCCLLVLMISYDVLLEHWWTLSKPLSEAPKKFWHFGWTPGSETAEGHEYDSIHSVMIAHSIGIESNTFHSPSIPILFPFFSHVFTVFTLWLPGAPITDLEVQFCGKAVAVLYLCVQRLPLLHDGRAEKCRTIINTACWNTNAMIKTSKRSMKFINLKFLRGSWFVNCDMISMFLNVSCVVCRVRGDMGRGPQRMLGLYQLLGLGRPRWRTQPKGTGAVRCGAVRGESSLRFIRFTWVHMSSLSNSEYLHNPPHLHTFTAFWLWEWGVTRSLPLCGTLGVVLSQSLSTTLYNYNFLTGRECSWSCSSYESQFSIANCNGWHSKLQWPSEHTTLLLTSLNDCCQRILRYVS